MGITGGCCGSFLGFVAGFAVAITSTMTHSYLPRQGRRHHHRHHFPHLFGITVSCCGSFLVSLRALLLLFLQPKLIPDLPRQGRRIHHEFMMNSKPPFLTSPPPPVGHDWGLLWVIPWLFVGFAVAIFQPCQFTPSKTRAALPPLLHDQFQIHFCWTSLPPPVGHHRRLL